ncbi:MAG: LuxR C-terminal-related transcriptional regulator [Armatimonadetes bacterium]|nr:LuxR C-terminal-related transcriptional regulator [Armatimonadota bacterium]
MKPPDGTTPTLSARELGVLHLAMEGLTDHAIAIQLDISMGTVNTYWSRIRTKYGAVSRTELVARYVTERAERAIAILRQENTLLLSALSQLDRNAGASDEVFSALKVLSENVADAVVVVDPEGFVRVANEPVEKLFGYARGELLGVALSALVPERFHGQHREHRAAYMAQPERRLMGGSHRSTAAIRKDGIEISIVATLDTCKSVEGLLVTCIIREL